MCLCIEDSPYPDENTTSTTEDFNVTTTVSEVTTSTEEPTTTLEDIPSTTFEWVIDTTTLPETTTTITTDTTINTNLANGLACHSNSECLSNNCIADVCCNKGQCGFDGKCYNSSEKRRDGKVCSLEVWKKVLGSRCVNDSECITNYCIDGFCCNKGQCAFGMGAACYSRGQVRYDLTMTCAGDSVWKKSLGQRCETNAECINGLCNNHYCCPSTQCPFKSACYKVGEITSDGVYKCMGDFSMKKRAGQSCGNGTECSSGFCTNGFCE
jgi:hypothetical protein